MVVLFLNAPKLNSWSAEICSLTHTFFINKQIQSIIDSFRILMVTDLFRMILCNSPTNMQGLFFELIEFTKLLMCKRVCVCVVIWGLFTIWGWRICFGASSAQCVRLRIFHHLWLCQDASAPTPTVFLTHSLTLTVCLCVCESNVSVKSPASLAHPNQSLLASKSVTNLLHQWV